MRTTILRPDDMKVGQFVTMLQGRIYKGDELSGNMLLCTEHQSGEENKQFNGMVLKIIAIDFPYVAVRDMANHTVHFDLREGWIFKILSKAYVNQYTKFTHNKCPERGKKC